MKTIKAAKPSKGNKKKIIIFGSLLLVLCMAFGIINSIKPPAEKEAAAMPYELGKVETISDIGTFAIKEIFSTKELRSADGYIFEPELRSTLLIVRVEFTANEPLTLIKQAATNWKPIDDNRYSIFPKLAAKYTGVDTSQFAIMTDEQDIINVEQMEFNKGEAKSIMYVINIPKAEAYNEIDFNFSPYDILAEGGKAVKNGEWAFTAKPDVK